jgi:hypothetical protein
MSNVKANLDTKTAKIATKLFCSSSLWWLTMCGEAAHRTRKYNGQKGKGQKNKNKRTIL